MIVKLFRFTQCDHNNMHHILHSISVYIISLCNMGDGGKVLLNVRLLVSFTAKDSESCGEQQV